MNKNLVAIFTVTFIISLAAAAISWDTLPVRDDPLVRSPGTQPSPENNADIEAPTRCMNCHGGYDSAAEPAFNWQGTMMAQAARDPIFWACMTVAAQDTIWAVGNPNATDICERCHFPKGWFEGRSDPSNATMFSGNDYDGVQCDVCHSMFDPFYETTMDGTREGNDWLDYWDETNASTTSSQDAGIATYQEDARLSADIKLFSGGNFYSGNQTKYGTYTENAAGQMFVDDVRGKRASFADADAKHQMYYSRYHKSKYFCSACHDVSNPVLANAGFSDLLDQSGGEDLITEQYSPSSFFHVERTFSEFMLSAYGQPGGAATNTEFQDQGAPNITHAAKCQDCHMRDVTCKGASQKSAVLRPGESVEHPNSGQPVHDMTGGNVWVGYILASLVPTSFNYDPVNEDLLVNQIYGPLTLNVNEGLGLDAERLVAGADRALQQLYLAATIKNIAYNSETGELYFAVQNNTGHKLISGFPEGRRMFINIEAYQDGNLIYAVNPYDFTAGTLKGLDYPYQTTLMAAPSPLVDGVEIYNDDLVYEGKPSSLDLTGEAKTFHFALATDRHKDNRIPPKGFRIDEAADRLSSPMADGEVVDDMYTAEEYLGGYDSVALTIPQDADYVEVNLYYQTTSREYMEFLRDEIEGTGNLTLAEGTGPLGLGDPNGPYLIQTDTSGFFAGMKAWGNTIWDLWTNNMDVPGAAPILMAQAISGDYGSGGCDDIDATVIVDPAETASNQVTLTWAAVSGAEGYIVYYDQAGKAQYLADVNETSFTDTNLTNGNVYCYKVSAYYTCDPGTSDAARIYSDLSNIVCATPQAVGQDTLVDVYDPLETGRYDTTGKGKNSITTFVSLNTFTAGDEVVLKAYVLDAGGLPVENASVEIVISGPETTTVSTGNTDVDGLGEAVWSTSAVNKKGHGGTTPGTYTATVTSVTGGGLVYSPEIIAGDAAVSFVIE